MDFNKNNKLKQLHKTIETIVKARQIQKAKVDSNVMKEELTQEELMKFHKPMVDQLTSIENKKSLLPIEGSMSSPLPIESPSTTLIPIEYTSKADLKDSLKNLETTLKKFFHSDEGIDKEIVKILYRFNMPSEIVKDKNLYDSNYNRVVQTLKSLGGQKRSKFADPEIDNWIITLNFYNERIKLIKKGLEQQSKTQTGSGIVSYKYYSNCDELIQRLNLLCGIKEAGNNSPEVRNEIVSILDILLKNQYINSKKHIILIINGVIKFIFKRLL
jgi:hypothetical protein